MTREMGKNEVLVRLLNKLWVNGSIIASVAFELVDGEQYLSVFRKNMKAEYAEDITYFMSKHPAYMSGQRKGEYKYAALNSDEVMNTTVNGLDEDLTFEVDVRPKGNNLKSHAGIFVRINGKNLMKGRLIKVKGREEGISADAMLIKVRRALLKMAVLKTGRIKEPLPYIYNKV